jgi:hypothetical protein
VITDVAIAVAGRKANPTLGLASRDPDGRRAAISLARCLHEDAQFLIDQRGPNSVLAVEFHSAPLRRDGSASDLAESLREIADWDWGDIHLMIEHCDAEVDTHEPQKGFLSLQEEIDAIGKSQAPFGISLNWGRSVVELRSATRAVDHVRAVSGASMLRAMIFSGTAGVTTPFGPAWSDAHLPPAPSPEVPDGTAGSLLDAGRIREALVAGMPEHIGLKIGWPDIDSPDVSGRLRLLRDSTNLVTAIARELTAEGARSGDSA